MIENIFYIIGKFILSFVSIFNNFGKFVIFQLQLLPLFFSPPFKLKEILRQISTIGLGSFGVVFLTAMFTGMVYAVQLYQGFRNFDAENFMGYPIFISITKELGPVFGALMVTSRSISAMAAELGTMRVTEQIDAIDTLSIDSRKYLLTPRIFATTISLPILIVLFDFVGNFSAYLVSKYVLDVNPISYQNMIQQYLTYSDIYSGIVKGFIFGYLISSIGTYIGYHTKGGARGVGEATTKAVVLSAITIFASDYLLSSLFLILNW